jgi:DNA polymerase-3 subunit gamma/tau
VALALYRKYRPATFAEVVGQEHVTEPLCTALAAKRINHAYLFSGPRGCGKTSSARILARSLNCVQGPTPTPCGVCNSCIGLAPEGPGTVDVVELDAASHGGVDDARELRDKAFYAPAESRYRVFIIDEAHMVTTQGFNALLKIVEEPPDHLVFIFATTEPDKVLGTIRSRTHHYPFRLIPPGAMRALLERNCEAEGVQVEPAVLPLVIRAGGGSARDTQSVLDQLLAGAGPGGVTYERAVSLLGVTDVGLIDDIVDGLAAGDGPAVFGTVDRVVEAGHDPRRFTTDLLERLRDLVLLKAVPDAADKGLVAMPEDELNRMRAQADQLGPATLTRYAEILHAGLVEMRGATAPRLLVELLCARMLLPSASASDAAVLQRLEGRSLGVGSAGRRPGEPARPAGVPAAHATGRDPAAAAGHHAGAQARTEARADTGTRAGRTVGTRSGHRVRSVHYGQHCGPADLAGTAAEGRGTQQADARPVAERHREDGGGQHTGARHADRGPGPPARSGVAGRGDQGHPARPGRGRLAGPVRARRRCRVGRSGRGPQAGHRHPVAHGHRGPDRRAEDDATRSAPAIHRAAARAAPPCAGPARAGPALVPHGRQRRAPTAGTAGRRRDASGPQGRGHERRPGDATAPAAGPARPGSGGRGHAHLAAAGPPDHLSCPQFRELSTVCGQLGRWLRAAGRR